MAGWGDFFGGIMDKLPIQGRIERWKNEVDNLTKEREKLVEGECDDKKAIRLGVIDKRLSYLLQLLKNKAGS
jgi:hypothetical protein